MLSSPEVWKEFFETYYRSEINKLAYRISEGDNTSRSIYVDFKDLTIFREGKLGEELLENPDIVMAHANAGLEMAENIYDVPLKDCVVRFYNLPTSRRVLIRDLRSIHISKFVAIEGIVRKVTEVRPRVVKAVFMCRVCGKKMEVEQEDSTLKPPYECRACKSKGRFIFIPEESLSTDSQRVRIQEYPENLRGGEQPQTIDVILEGDLAGEVNPGDRVIINGIVRARPKGVGQRRLAHMDLYIEGNSVEVLQQEYEEFEITEEDKKKIIALSKDPNIYDKIVKSIAPAIYGYEDIKLAIALQLFGGVPKKLPDGTEIRGDIHILLVGDPGVAKCVDYDTEVLLSDGSLVKIGDLVEKVLMNRKKKIDDGFYAETNHDIISLDSCTLKLRSSKANIVWKRYAPEIMFKIRTKTGRTIKVTPTHPFFTIRDGKFVTVKAKDLKKGDLIATPRIIPVFGKPQPIPNDFEARNAVRLKLPKKTSPEFWRFVALFIADGHAQNRNGCATIYFTNNDNKLINEFINYAKKLGLNPKLRNPHEGKTAKEVVISSVELYNFFDLLGINGRSKVPNLLFRCSREEIKAFLSAFFDAEASVDKRRPKITVTSASEKLLRQIQHLLLRFGIISQLHETYSRTTNSRTPKLRKYYRLTITGENALKFAEEIGFTVESKICSWEVKNNPNLDVIPDVSTILRETRRLLGLTQSECGVSRNTYQHLERGGRKPSRNTLAKIVEAFKSKLNGNKQAEFNVRFLELLANSDIFWDEVVEIETYKPEHPFVYDLQVLEHHNFVANDVFVHNSQLLRYVHRIAPRSVYTTGKGTTTAGLTATAVRDEIDGRWTLEAGALVLADKGIALVDEIDKMRREDRSALHEALEQQTVSIAKAGINAILRARCALLAAANPKHGRFNRYEPLVEQIDLSPTLLSRFDLIFILTDEPDEKKDELLARHVLDVHELGERLEQSKVNPINPSIVEAKAEKIKPAIEPELLRKYIAYAKKTVFPVLTKEAKDKIVEFYKSLRAMAKSDEHESIPITARQLEALIRLAEASARVRLSNEVTVEDAERAIRIFKKSLEQIAIDPETGKIDIDYAFTGTSATQRDRIAIIKRIIEELEKEHERGAPEEEILRRAEERGISREKAEEILSKLRQKGEIYSPRYGYYRVVKYD